MANFNHFKEKVEFYDEDFRYEFNKEEYILILFTDENKKLINIQRKNFKDIYDIKNIILRSNDNHYKWYIEKCETCFANKITFKIKYFIEYFSDDLKCSKITLTSPAINEIFHPAKYFYNNIDKAKNDILYNNIIMKEDKIKIDGIEYKIDILIGQLLGRGICSGFSDFVKMEIKIDKELELKEIVEIIEKIKITFQIIGLTKSVYFDNIDVGSENHFIYRIHERQEKLDKPLPNVNLFFNNIFVKIFKKRIKTNDLEYRLFDNNDNEINFLYLCRAFEQNFKKRFPKFKSRNRNNEEEQIINELLNMLEEKTKTSFTEGLEHKLNSYKNKFFNQLIYAFSYYEKYFEDTEQYSYASEAIKNLKMKDLDNVIYSDFLYSVERINKLRNTMAHEDLSIVFSIMDRFWINAFAYVVYTMILKNLELNKEEILELLTNIHINIIN